MSGLSVALANAKRRLFLFKDTSELTVYSWGQHMNVLEASSMSQLWDAGQKMPITVNTGSDTFWARKSNAWNKILAHGRRRTRERFISKEWGKSCVRKRNNNNVRERTQYVLEGKVLMFLIPGKYLWFVWLGKSRQEKWVLYQVFIISFISSLWFQGMSWALRIDNGGSNLGRHLKVHFCKGGQLCGHGQPVPALN